jgi:hypothetical protein
MSKKIDWMSDPALTGSMSVTALPSAPVLVTDEGNMPGWSFEKVSKNSTARSEALGCGVAGFFLIQSWTAASWAFVQVSI